jgi:tetratricopeptide (TPR) repeat protein
LDPQFAYGYVALATSQFGLYEFQQASANLSKAFDLRQQVTQRERFAIEGYYYDWVTGELDKVSATHKEWAQTYPKDYVPHVRLSAYYRTVGQLDKAVTEAQTAVKLAPDNAVAAFYLMTAEIRTNRFDLAKAVYDDARTRKLNSPMLHRQRYLIAFLQGDEKTMRQMVESAAAIPMARDLMLKEDSSTQAYRGRVRLARELSARSAELARSSASSERAAIWKCSQAAWEAELGFPERAVKLIGEALSSKSQDVSAVAAIVLARSGDLGRAKLIADKLAQEYPLNTEVRYQWVPIVRAATAIKLNRSEEAIEALRVVVPYELTSLGPAYLRGLAYLQARTGVPAAAEFQKLLDHPGIVENNPEGALAHLQLGRAQVMMGDKAAARKSYQDFLTLWKDADPDIPIYQQAKTEYAKLQ